MLAAMTGSTMRAGILTIPAEASQSVRVWATVKAEICSRSGFHFRVIRKTPRTNRIWSSPWGITWVKPRLISEPNNESQSPGRACTPTEASVRPPGAAKISCSVRSRVKLVSPGNSTA